MSDAAQDQDRYPAGQQTGDSPLPRGVAAPDVHQDFVPAVTPAEDEVATGLPRRVLIGRRLGNNGGAQAGGDLGAGHNTGLGGGD